MLNIEDNTIEKFLEISLSEIRHQTPPIIDCCCPACGLPISHPMVARKSDVDDFKKLMESAYAVLKRHGVTAMLLSEIHADIAITKAKQPAPPGDKP
jgi:hypothetical protein